MTGLSNLIRSESRLLARDPAIYFVAALPVLLVVVFGLLPSTGKPSEDFGGRRMIDFYVPALVTMIIAMMALNLLTSVLGAYREKGVLRRLAVTPVKPMTLMIAQGVVNLVVLMAVAALVLGIGLVAFDVALPKQVAGFALALLLTITSMFAIGLLIAAVSPNGKAANGIGTVVFFPLAFLAGLWTPGPAMPDVIRRIAGFSPLGAGVQAMQRAWDGSFPQPLHLLVLLAFTLGIGLLAAKRFRWE
jgi:ABC-2 type transport system permease protein